MAVLLILGAVLLIFGGGLFIVTLFRFWIVTLVNNHRIRIHNRLILERAYRQYMGLY